MFFKYQAIRIYYEVKGSGQPMIFLHGWGSSSSTFMNIIDELIPKYQIYLIDLPSFGNSQEPANPISIKELKELLCAFIDKLNIDHPIILGHSYGGRIAIEYAASSLNIKKLILVDSAGIRRHKLIKKVKVLIYKLKKSFYKHTKQLMKYQHLTSSSGSTDYQNASPIQKEMLIKAVNYDQKTLLKKITCDTLIIFGEKDIVTPIKDAKTFKRKIKKSGLVLVPNARHFPYLENEYYFLKVLKNYLEV